MAKIPICSFFALGMISLLLLSIASTLSLNNTLSLDIFSRKNQTGHLISQASVSSNGGMAPSNWKLNILQSNFEHKGVQSYRVVATFVAPPHLPSDYEHFPGVGYYKFHTNIANGFEDASSQCAMEGGHLAIVNSEAEHQVLQTMFARHPKSKLKNDYAYVGFHDRHKEGEFYTIFGQPLQTTGYTRWSFPNQPDNAGGNENCGSVHRNGGLNDDPCTKESPFFCEYDLSWAEN